MASLNPTPLHTLSSAQGTSGYQLDHLMADIPDVVQALGHTSCVLVAHDCEYNLNIMQRYILRHLWMCVCVCVCVNFFKWLMTAR